MSKVINIAQTRLRCGPNLVSSTGAGFQYSAWPLGRNPVAEVFVALVDEQRYSQIILGEGVWCRIAAAICERCVMPNSQPFVENRDAGTLAQAIVDTVREPLLVLDKDLRVLAASRSFYLTFKVTSINTQGQLLYTLGDGQWDIPELRLLLEKIVPEHGVMEDYEVEHEFPEIGKRTMLLNARKVFYEGNSHTTLLLGIEDVTERRAAEREREAMLRKQQALLQEKDVLLEELEHRVGNSLQIIAAIILMKSRMVTSEETRLHLQDAHKRVMSVAAVQKHLHATGPSGPVEMAPYLTQLCESLKTSMIADYRPAVLEVTSDAGTVSSREAVSLGLIVTELILNALKHAFVAERIDRQIAVGFAVAGTNWKLSVVDNGVGAPIGVFAQAKTGLGTSIVNALAQQLDAKVDVVSGPQGTSVSVTHATFAKKPDAISNVEALRPTSIHGRA
jgi:two-component sensor histidine kinase/PAS domain-containing protein